MLLLLDDEDVAGRRGSLSGQKPSPLGGRGLAVLQMDPTPLPAKMAAAGAGPHGSSPLDWLEEDFDSDDDSGAPRRGSRAGSRAPPAATTTTAAAPAPAHRPPPQRPQPPLAPRPPPNADSAEDPRRPRPPPGPSFDSRITADLDNGGSGRGSRPESGRPGSDFRRGRYRWVWSSCWWSWGGHTSVRPSVSKLDT